MTEHQLLGEGVNAMTLAATQAQARGQRALFLNAVSWLAAQTPTYALAHDGVIFLPGYIDPTQLITVQTGAPVTPLLARYDDIFPIVPYYVGLIGTGPDWAALQGAPTQVYSVDYSRGGAVQPVGQLGVAWSGVDGAAGFAATAESAPTVFLRQADVARQGDALRLSLVWQIASPPPLSLTPFAHILDADGVLIAQADGHPVGRTYPLGLWIAGQIVVDQRQAVAAGAAQVLVGLFDNASGQRWTALSPATRQPFSADAVPIWP
jgi:hypothetical protein